MVAEESYESTYEYTHVVRTIELTNTQRIQVGIVSALPIVENSEQKIGIQKLWRRSDADEWKLGKGLHVSLGNAKIIGEGIYEIIALLEIKT